MTHRGPCQPPTFCDSVKGKHLGSGRTSECGGSRRDKPHLAPCPGASLGQPKGLGERSSSSAVPRLAEEGSEALPWSQLQAAARRRVQCSSPTDHFQDSISLLLEAVRTKNEELAQTWKKSEQWATIEQLCSKKGVGVPLGGGPSGQGWAELAGGRTALLSNGCGGCWSLGQEQSCSLVPCHPCHTEQGWRERVWGGGLQGGISSAQLWGAGPGGEGSVSAGGSSLGPGLGQVAALPPCSARGLSLAGTVGVQISGLQEFGAMGGSAHAAAAAVWACQHCTFMNQPGTDHCEMCSLPRT